MARLIVEEGPEEGEAHPIGGTCVIGRGEPCDVRLNDTVASLRHAEVRMRTDGYHVSDLRSSNGTRVNGERVRGSRLLVDGDRITIGRSVFRFDTGSRIEVGSKPGKQRGLTPEQQRHQRDLDRLVGGVSRVGPRVSRVAWYVAIVLGTLYLIFRVTVAILGDAI